MARFGLSALRSLLGRRGTRRTPWQPPEASWSRRFGLGWDSPYTVRYASNLDDGPDHGMPLGGFGAGCLGRSPSGAFNLWNLDGGEHWFGSIPDCQFALWERPRQPAPNPPRGMPWSGPSSRLLAYRTV